MSKILSLVIGFLGGVYTSQNYKIPCIRTEFYKILEELEKKKK